MSRYQYIKYRLKYRWAPYLNLKLPVDVALELSSHCNCKCPMCYHADPKNLPFKKGHMSMHIAGMILDSCADCEIPSVKLNWKGEPTLNPNFKAICEYAKNLSNSKRMFERITNSNFFFSHKREDIFEGLAMQTKVKISFDSFFPAAYELQRYPADFQKVLSNIDTFYNLPGRDNEMVIQCVRTQLNKNEDIEGTVKRRWPSAKVSIRDMVEGRVKKNTDKLSVRKRNKKFRQPCLQAFCRLVFDHEGFAMPCCPDIEGKLRLGHIDHRYIEPIFNSIKAKKLRRDLLDKSAFMIEPCLSCSSFESYKGYRHPLNS